MLQRLAIVRNVLLCKGTLSVAERSDSGSSESHSLVIVQGNHSDAGELTVAYPRGSKRYCSLQTEFNQLARSKYQQA